MAEYYNNALVMKPRTVTEASSPGKIAVISVRLALWSAKRTKVPVLQPAVILTGRATAPPPPQAQTHGSRADHLGEGDGTSLSVADIPAIGRTGGIICWGELHASGTHAPLRQDVQLLPGSNCRPARFLQATLRHIACEGRCYVLGF